MHGSCPSQGVGLGRHARMDGVLPSIRRVSSRGRRTTSVWIVSCGVPLWWGGSCRCVGIHPSGTGAANGLDGRVSLLSPRGWWCGHVFHLLRHWWRTRLGMRKRSPSPVWSTPPLSPSSIPSHRCLSLSLSEWNGRWGGKRSSSAPIRGGGMDPLLQDIDRMSVSFDSLKEDRDGKGHAWEISVGSKGSSDTRATSFGLTSHDARAWTHTPTTTSQDDDKPRRRHEIVRDQRRPSLRKEDSEARET